MLCSLGAGCSFGARVSEELVKKTINKLAEFDLIPTTDKSFQTNVPGC
jgi:hypothetical protein